MGGGGGGVPSVKGAEEVEDSIPEPTSGMHGSSLRPLQIGF